jgi:ferredoxin
VSTEWLDKPGVFGEPIARNFLHTGMLDNRFFTLMIFLHIAAPLIALVIMWIHLQRVTKPRINPPRGLALGTFGSMLALSLIYPALSQGPASLSEVPGSVGLDWFYLGLYPLLDTWPGTVTWSATGTLLFILCAMPWLPPLRRTPPAAVDLENCNGCSRCFNDCPYNAIMMAPRTDALPFESQPFVSASLCTSCGICAGSCPTAMPFRRHSALRAGIDLPDHSIPGLRSMVHEASEKLEGEARILVFGCEHGPPLEDIAGPSTGIVSMRCLGQLPPSFIDYVLSKDLADGVLLAACTDNNCYFRFGERWTSQRIARQRDPHLRARVPAERLATCQTGPLGRRKLESAIKDLTASVARSKGDGQAAVSGGHTRRRSQSHD